MRHLRNPDLWLEQSPQLLVPIVVWGTLLLSRASQSSSSSLFVLHLIAAGAAAADDDNFTASSGRPQMKERDGLQSPSEQSD